MTVRDDIAYKIALYKRETREAHLPDVTDPMAKKDGGHVRGKAAMITLARRNAKRDGFDWEIRVYEKSADQVRALVHPDGTITPKKLPNGAAYQLPAKRLGEAAPDAPTFEIDDDAVAAWETAFAD